MGAARYSAPMSKLWSAIRDAAFWFVYGAGMIALLPVWIARLITHLPASRDDWTAFLALILYCFLLWFAIH